MLDKTRELVVKEYIDKTYPWLGKEEKKSIQNNILSNMSGQLISNKKDYKDVIDGDEINSDLEQLYLDLKTAYAYTNAIENTVESNLHNYMAKLNNIQLNAIKCSKKLDQYEYFMMAKGKPIYIIENFEDISSFEPNLKYYSERYGERVHEFTTDVLNTESPELILPKTMNNDMINYDDTVKAAKVKIKRQFCSSMKDYTVPSSLQNITTINKSKVWNETIISDSVIEIPERNEHFFINTGALCEIIIDFEAVTVINELTIVPSSEYPVDILKITYSLTDNSSLSDKTINIKDSNEPITLDKPITLRFNSILAKSISLTLNQPHYIRKPISYSKKNVSINSFLYENNNGSFKENKIFAPIYEDKTINNHMLTVIDSSLERNSSTALSTLFLKDEEDLTRDIKYIYNYGLESVIARNVQYDKTGVFVSSPIDSIGDISSVGIETEEFHEEGDGRVITDIEYYVSHSENPKFNDWKPILPLNKDIVHKELLQVYKDKCFLRFRAIEIKEIMIDDIVLSEGSDFALERDKEGFVTAVIIPDYDFVSIYTCSYIPDKESACSVNYTDENSSLNSEVFVSDGQSSFQLKNEVFISKTSKPSVKIVDMENNVVYSFSSGNLKDVTDIFNQSDSYNNFSKKDSSYQFYIYKNGIYFNKALPKGFFVDIIYNSKVSSLRFKAILRRNHGQFKYITPSVSKIKYIFTGEE